ncbi:MAG: CoA transferase [Chloroflexi bacterium]|nr:CoA transferase [Chloroflexota bacterium]
MAGPLDGIRVADFTWVWAGPTNTMQLAHMGAEVIRMETSKRICTLRMFPPWPDGKPGPNRSGYFNQYNQGKRAILLDLTKDEGATIARRLVEISDVAVENFAAGVIDRLGFGYDDLRRLRPDIIMISMPAFGSTGPWKDFIQYGIGQEQLGGIASMNGYLDDPSPVKSGVNFGDPVSGAHAAAAVLSALYRRRRTGQGLFIDLSQLESSIMTIGEHLLGFQMNGRNPGNRGNRHPVYAPHGVYRCAGDDQWVTIAVSSDAEWKSLCQGMGRPELAADARFADLLARRKHQDEIDEIISEWTQDRDSTEVMNDLQSRGVAATPVLKGEGIFNDPHVQERGLLELVDHPAIGPYFMPGISWKMSETPGTVRWPAPTLGEHNGRIYGDLLGMSETAVADLVAEGVSGTTPDIGAN